MSRQTVLITGASRGLGLAAAHIAAQLGANVALNARSVDDLAAAAQQIQASGGVALSLPGDVSRPDDCQRLVEQVIERFGCLDALVNNAGIIEPIAPLAQADPQAWKKNLDINLLGPVLLTRVALPCLRKTGGRVINVSSGAAVNMIPGWGAYSAAKVALNHITRLLAIEEEAIIVIAFRPGAVATQMQAIIRQEGATGMPRSAYARFLRLYQEKQLLPAELPGRALAVLALHAPHEWSGSFVSWNDDQVRSLVNRYAPG